MRRLLDGLKKVQEDEKQANGVMVRPSIYVWIWELD
jgi:hypothetical protein